MLLSCLWHVAGVPLMCVWQARENSVLREDQVHYNELKNEVTKLQASEKAARQTRDRVAELEGIVARLQAELQTEKASKDAVVKEKDNLRQEKDGVSKVEMLRLLGGS